MLLLTLILVPLYGIFLIVSQFSKTYEHENIKLLKIIILNFYVHLFYCMKIVKLLKIYHIKALRSKIIIA